MGKNNQTQKPAAEASEAADSVTCVVASPLKFDGTRFAEGDSVTLPKALYDELKAAGVVTAPDPETAASAEKPAA
jgi:hypothetical protein